MLLPQLALAAGKDNSPNLDDAAQGENQISPKVPASRPISIEQSMRLRRDLDEYSKTVDPAHVQIEERRRVMHQRVQTRFIEADRDNDGYISRSEALESLPQVVRHFTYVDENGDNLISLEELEVLQARILAQRPVPRFEANAGKIDSGKIEQSTKSDQVRSEQARLENAKDMVRSEQAAAKMDSDTVADTEGLASKRKSRDLMTNTRKRSL